MKGREKKREKQQRVEHNRLQDKERLETVLSALGLLDGFRDLPGTVRQAAFRALPGRPKVVLSPTARRSPTLLRLKDELEADLTGARMSTEEGKSFPYLDFPSVCLTLPGGFSSLASAPLSLKQRTFAERAAGGSAAFVQERIGAAEEWLGNEVMLHLMMYSRMDAEVFGCILGDRPLLPGKPVCQLALQSSEPREVRVEIDGQMRPAFQCAVPYGLEGIRWVECDGAAFDLDRGRQYPLFLQSHAIRRLHERLATSTLITDVTVHLGLMSTVAKLSVVERRGDTYLIAFHFGDLRVGYLVARIAQGKVVITTFLLVTMEGAPEGRLLRQKLRLTRRDIEYERLDRLETFLMSDVLADKELVNVLEECGCGSLLDLARINFPADPGRFCSEELRQFLRLADKGKPRAFRMHAPPSKP